MEQILVIESIAFGGAGVGRLPEGCVCFVPGTLPGERVAVRVVKQKKNFAEGELVRLLERSPQRVKPRCPVFGTCGGCAYQHAEYDLQLEFKTRQVAELLRRMGGLADVEVRPTLPSPQQWEYRNRISAHVENGVVGFYGRKSRRLVPVNHCPIAAPGVNEQLAALAANPPYSDTRITLRQCATHRGFSQVNDGGAEVLLSAVREALQGGAQALVDAYCGAGFFARGLGDLFPSVLGIEWSDAAVQSAMAAAREGESYLQGPVEDHLPAALAKSAPEETVLVVDPPAEGLSSDVVFAIRSRPPGRLIYVSCDPATLARDLKVLSDLYEVRHLQPVDMFPQTAEIEVVASCTLRRQNSAP